MKTFRSNGKLLLTAEYAVLDGALALALPSKFGQSLSVELTNYPSISWTSYDEKASVWFTDTFKIRDIISQSDIKFKNPISYRIYNILKVIHELNEEFFRGASGYKISTHLDFNRFWGLGTSSTLINNLAHWTGVDAYKLLSKTFGGSGYDIACAEHKGPLLYQRLKGHAPIVEPVAFKPPFSAQLYFVYLDQKQNSRDGISRYKTNAKINPHSITALSAITKSMVECKSLVEFNALINTHELIISELIDLVPIKEQLFNDFEGQVKSLGAWGGDFVLATCEYDPSSYFKSKGLNTVFTYDQMVL